MGGNDIRLFHNQVYLSMSSSGRPICFAATLDILFSVFINDLPK